MTQEDGLWVAYFAIINASLMLAEFFHYFSKLEISIFRIYMLSLYALQNRNRYVNIYKAKFSIIENTDNFTKFIYTYNYLSISKKL